jgi:molecular chaperone GrpE
VSSSTDTEHEGDPGSTPSGPTVRDRRRIDPETFEVREPQHAAPAPAGSSDDTTSTTSNPAEQGSAGEKDTRVSELETALAERTADLQRLQAEYVNYKRRVDRDREATRQASVASVLTSLLPVLDDIGRAREHEELTGGFKAVADSLERTVTSLGLVSFGTVGDEFDPRIHEALMHTYSSDVEGPVCVAVLQVGYRLGDRIVRPARVAVAEPEESPQQPPVESATHDSTVVETDGDDVEQLDALTPDSNDSNA